MKSIIFTLALLLAGIFTMNAGVVTSPNTVGSGDWKEGNYFYLKNGDYFLSLDNEKIDSVIVRTFDDNTDYTKDILDYALWEIKSTYNAGGTLYSFINKRTGSELSFGASEGASLNLAPGISQWTFTSGIIRALYDNSLKSMTLNVESGKLKLDPSGNGSQFSVYAPDTKFVLTAAQLGDGFQIFQLEFDQKYDGNIFEGKDLLAKDIAGNEGYVTLQIQGDETFANGKAKYLGVDTLKTTINNAERAFGAQFAIDSTRVSIRPNADWQKFRFTIDLINDSLNIEILAAPTVNQQDMATVSNVKIVYANLAEKKVLTVSDYNTNGNPKQGTLPSIKRKRGTPGSISTGSGVYFLKSAGKGETAGKYIVKTEGNKLITMEETPSTFLPEGQWYIKETDNLYSIVDRNTNTSLLMAGEIFPVQGIPNTFTFGSKSDSITVEYQDNISLDNLFLGALHFTAEETAQNGYVLSLLAAAIEDGLPIVASDSILQVKTSGVAQPIIFKLETKEDSIKNTGIKTGALLLGDTLYHSLYVLKEMFTDKYIAYDEGKAAFKLSSVTTPNVFIFSATAEAGEYALNTDDNYVSMDVASANLIKSATLTKFTIEAIEAQEYATFNGSHKRITSDNRSLTMNPLTTFAEMKTEGQEILKANYETDHFSLWVEKASVTPTGKQLYHITKSIKVGSTTTLYYLVSLRSFDEFDNSGNALVGFVPAEDLGSMNQALFAFKLTEDGRYQLESQDEIANGTGKPFIGVVNNRVVMSSIGIDFDIETVSGPTSNEKAVVSDVTVIGEKSRVIVRNAASRKITVVNILGQVISMRYATSDYFAIPAPQGAVLVVIDGKPTQKVLVK